MDVNELTINALTNALAEIQTYKTDRNPQRLDQILPVAVLLIKNKIQDISHEEKKEKFFAPVWVDRLMDKLAHGERLSDVKYAMYQTLVSQLRPKDYKLCADNIFAYGVRYLTTNEIMETISALKKYFHVR